METERAKKYFWILLDLVLAAAFLNVVFFVMPMLQRLGDSFQPVRTVTVSAEGTATVSPDLAQFSFSVVTQGKNPDEIVDENNRKVSAAVDFVKSRNVDSKDVKTTAYNLNPDYEYDEKIRKSVISGYTITQSVSVKIREFKTLPGILSGLTPRGVNQVGGVSFTVEDQEKYLGAARAQAFERAFAKAKAMAKENGVSLGRVVNISEFAPGPIYPVFGVAEKLSRGPDTASVAPPAIEPGTEEVKVQVSVTYTFR